MNKTSTKTRRITTVALLFAVAIVLSYVETLLPSGFLPAGIKPGLSNIATMFCALCMGPLPAFALAVLKSLFALFTRGAVAALLSACGGLLSVSIILLIHRVFPNASYITLSVCGAVSHNAAQLAIAVFLLYSDYLWWYAPVLLLSGIVMGTLTALILHFVMPALTKATGYTILGQDAQNK